MKSYKSYKGKTVLITGAFGGFGQKFMKNLLNSGAKLILTDIAEKPIADVFKEEGISTEYEKNVLATIVVDLISKGGPQELYDKCKAIGEVDVIIHNAGTGVGGFFQDIPFEKTEMLLKLMVNAPMEVTHLFLPDFIKRKSGQFVFISSVAGVVATYYGLGYTASKFAIKAFGMGLHQEVKRAGIKVSVVYPFFTRTNIIKAATYGNAPIPPLPNFIINDPDKVIAETMRGMNRNKLHIRPGGYSKYMYFMSKIYAVSGPMMLVKPKK
jgi:short-subunit dehydrogenase